MSELNIVLPTGNNDQQVSFRAFEAMLRMATGGNRIFRRMTPASYSDFVSTLYEDIDEIINDLENRKRYFNESTEDQISDAIIGELKRFGYAAHHDKDSSGHVDITVEFSGGKQLYTWLGEAKIDRGPSYCHGGYQQLTTRYSTARANSDQGGLLIYNQNYDNAAGRIAQWATYLTNDHGIVCEADTGRPSLAFSTNENHKGTGLPYRVRHMIVHLHYAPEK